MRCLRGFALIGIILVTLLFVSGGGSRQQSNDLLITALRSTGANLQETSVHGWTKLPGGTWTEAALLRIVYEGIAARGEQPESYRFESTSSDSHDSVYAIRTADHYREAIAATAARDQSVAIMTVTISGMNEQIGSWEQQAAKILYASGGIPRISSCLQGWINGKLNTGEQRDILSHSFALMDATFLNEMDDARVSSIIGYSPRLPGGLIIDGVRVNVNMALRYSSTDNRTYITLGTPIIAREY